MQQEISNDCGEPASYDVNNKIMNQRAVVVDAAAYCYVVLSVYSWL